MCSSVNISLISLIFINLLVHEAFCANVQCRNEKGDPVDWFYLYKLPRTQGHQNPLIEQGVAYVYVTPDKSSEWTLSDIAITDPGSIAGRTLQPLYEREDIVSLLYNDEPAEPDAEFGSTVDYDHVSSNETEEDYQYNFSCGHTKGAVLGDSNTAVWLVHSVPKFPPKPTDPKSKYAYPHTGTKFGQTFLCLSIRTSDLELVATQLAYNTPQIYHTHMPTQFQLPKLADVMRNKTINDAPWYHIQELKTLKGSNFTSFAKSARFGQDLYSGLIARVFKSDLRVESWINGRGVLHSDCLSKYKVYNVEHLSFPALNLKFSSHNDHAKWAVVQEANKQIGYWICVGDINRAEEQEKRGGGTVCIANMGLWKLFSQLVADIQPCDTYYSAIQI